MMETIRVTEDEQRRIAEAAAGNGVSKQKFCLASIMDHVTQWEKTPAPQAAIPDGQIEVCSFRNGQPEREPILIDRPASFPASIQRATQFSDGGTWYFFDQKDDIVSCLEDFQMQPLLPNPDMEHTLTTAS